MEEVGSLLGAGIALLGIIISLNPIQKANEYLDQYKNDVNKAVRREENSQELSEQVTRIKWRYNQVNCKEGWYRTRSHEKMALEPFMEVSTNSLLYLDYAPKCGEFLITVMESQQICDYKDFLNCLVSERQKHERKNRQKEINNFYKEQAERIRQTRIKHYKLGY